MTPKQQPPSQQTSLATTCIVLQSPQSLWLSMRLALGVSLTLLGKGRGQDGDLLLLQLSDFILQLANSLSNCPDLRKVTKRAEGDMGVLQTALLLGPLSPLAKTGRDPASYLLEELLVRAPQPGGARVYHQRDQLLVLIVRTVIPLPGPGLLALLPCCCSLPEGLTDFRVFPS